MITVEMRIVTLALMLCAAVAGAAKFDCSTSTFDKCNEKLFMVGDDTFVFPKNINEMNKRCKELKRLESCTKTYSSKCLKDESKQSVSVLLYGVTKTNKGYCNTSKRKNAFIKMTKCLTKHKLKMDKAMWQMSSEFKAIADLFPDKKTKIPLACCNYYKFKQTCMAVMSKECTADEAAEFESLVDGYAVDILGLLCGDYTEESDRCSKIIGQTPKWTKKTPSKIFVLPLVDILDSI